MKRFHAKCVFCCEDEYCTLHCHRILPGEQGGKYSWANTTAVCCRCHALIHAGKIVIHGRRLRSDGRYILHCEIDGREHFLPILSVLDDMPIPTNQELEQFKKSLHQALGLAFEMIVQKPEYFLSPNLREMAGEKVSQARELFNRLENYLMIDNKP